MSVTSTTTSHRRHVPAGSGEHVVCVIHSRRSADATITGALPAQYRVSTAPVGRAVTDDVAGLLPHAVLVDASTGDFDATRLCRDLASATSVPVLVVAESGADDSLVIDLLDAGAADVLTGDVRPAVLHARLRAALRTVPPVPRPNRLSVGDVIVDLDGHVVYIDDEPVECPPLLFSLLVALASAPNTVATRESLLTRVWGVEPATVDTRRLRVAASLLRRLLGKGPRRPRLETVARIGYRLAVD